LATLKAASTASGKTKACAGCALTAFDEANVSKAVTANTEALTAINSFISIVHGMNSNRESSGREQ
jgi:hypothetical protein